MAEQNEHPDDAREGVPTGDHHELSPEEAKARNGRNIAIAFGIIGFVALVYLTSILRLAQNVGGTG